MQMCVFIIILQTCDLEVFKYSTCHEISISLCQFKPQVDKISAHFEDMFRTNSCQSSELAYTFENEDLTPPKTNSLPLKIDPWKRRFLLETTIFRGYVSFRECKSDAFPSSVSSSLLEKGVFTQVSDAKMWVFRVFCIPKKESFQNQKKLGIPWSNEWGFPKKNKKFSSLEHEGLKRKKNTVFPWNFEGTRTSEQGSLYCQQSWLGVPRASLSSDWLVRAKLESFLR